MRNFSENSLGSSGYSFPFSIVKKNSLTVCEIAQFAVPVRLIFRKESLRKEYKNAKRRIALLLLLMVFLHIFLLVTSCISYSTLCGVNFAYMAIGLVCPCYFNLIEHQIFQDSSLMLTLIEIAIID